MAPMFAPAPELLTWLPAIWEAGAVLVGTPGAITVTSTLEKLALRPAAGQLVVTHGPHRVLTSRQSACGRRQQT